MTITRPSTLTEEEMNKLMQGLADRGAKITMADPRVTSVQTWIMLAVGAAFITVGTFIISSVNELNKNMAIVIQQNAYAQRTNDAQDARLNIYDDRLRSVERAIK